VPEPRFPAALATAASPAASSLRRLAGSMFRFCPISGLFVLTAKGNCLLEFSLMPEHTWLSENQSFGQCWRT
jgi:hypothetical protein